MKLKAEFVTNVFTKCLFTDQEVKFEHEDLARAIKVEGVTMNVGFHPDRLKSYESVIVELLAELPPEFHEATGGGWSFLNACLDKDGNQWGEQSNVQDLLLLGLGIDKVKYCLPRGMWDVLPGKVPYFMVKS